jgi:hypothetical protein
MQNDSQRKIVMTDFDTDNGSTRDDLLQRVALMESMIAEGRRMTMRCGWAFVLWGLVDLAAMSWQWFQPQSRFAGKWAWPICLIAGVVLTLVGAAWQKSGGSHRRNMQCGSVIAVWSMMGAALAIYVASAMVRHLTWQYSYMAGILIIIGMAHAISAAILRWRVQAAVAVIWWVGAIAMFFVPPHFVPTEQRAELAIWFAEMVLCMLAFGLYSMMLERNERAGQVSQHV